MRQRFGIAGELEFRLFEVVGVEVEVAEGVDEVADFEVADMGDHVGEQCIGCDVERDAEEEVGTALVELAGQARAALVAGFVDIELEEQVAGGQSHFVNLPDIPCRNDVAA